VDHADEYRYLVAKLFQPLIGCETSSLRALNVATLCLILPLSYVILRMLRTQTTGILGAGATKSAKRAVSDSTIILDANTALNIALFPPLFFFSALFYTDVMSTLVVLVSYCALLNRKSPQGSAFDIMSAVIIGVIALVFRQTNIFWVAIFPAGLSVIDALKADALPAKSSMAVTVSEVLKRSWEEGYVHDCYVQDAGLPGTFELLM
jgi:alpha-1,2-glucosyltransferase